MFTSSNDRRPWGITSASIGKDRPGRPALNIELDQRGAALLSALSKANIDRPLACIVGGRIVLIAVIRSEISKNVQVAGFFTENELRQILAQLSTPQPGPAYPTLRILDEEGKPADINHVTMWVRTDGGGGRGFDFAATPTSQRGVYRIENLLDHEFVQLSITKPGYAPFWLDPFPPRTQWREKMLCRLSKGGTIRGKVVNEAEQAIPGVRVSVNSILGREDPVTNSEGEFVAEHLATTEYTIIAEPDADSPYAATVLKGGASPGASNLMITLHRKSSTTSSPQTEIPSHPSTEPADLDQLGDASARSMARIPASTSPASRPAAEAGNTPRIRVDEPIHDFGALNAGTTLTHAIRITNAGKADLHINKVTPSCGCTTAGTYAKVLKPGEAGEISLTVNTSSFHGSFIKTVTIDSDDPATPRFLVKLTGEATSRPAGT